MKRFSLSNFSLRNKTVFLRADYNVPLEKGKIEDKTKILESLPTINFLLKQNCKIILATHLGRPEGKIVPSLKVNLLGKEIEKLLGKKVKKFNDCIGRDIKKKIEKGKTGEIFLLENLRFYKEEEKNDFTFAHSLADLADVYVNDAFGAAHRKHASIVGITRFLPSASGLLLDKEFEQLSKALKPKGITIWIIGGAKLKKIGFIEQALKKANYVLLGGALPFAFLRAKRIPIGMSRTDLQSIRNAQKLLKKRAAKKIIFPLDFVVAKRFSPRTSTKVVPYNQIGTSEIGLDIGPETIRIFKQYLRKAQNIVWNGPMGYSEWEKFSRGTKEIGRQIGKLTATSICGGGETVAAIRKFHLEHGLTHISTGGGATLAFLSGKKLPAITALERNYKMFRKK